MALTNQGGKLLLRNGKLGTGQACCCGGACDCAVLANCTTTIEWFGMTIEFVGNTGANQQNQSHASVPVADPCGGNFWRNPSTGEGVLFTNNPALLSVRCGQIAGAPPELAGENLLFVQTGCVIGRSSQSIYYKLNCNTSGPSFSLASKAVTENEPLGIGSSLTFQNGGTCQDAYQRAVDVMTEAGWEELDSGYADDLCECAGDCTANPVVTVTCAP